MRRVPLFLLFFSLFISSILNAQTGKIAGTITDQSTGDPLIGVNVQLARQPILKVIM
jgi:hypothetical protein